MFFVCSSATLIMIITPIFLSQCKFLLVEEFHLKNTYIKNYAKKENISYKITSEEICVKNITYILDTRIHLLHLLYII